MPAYFPFDPVKGESKDRGDAGEDFVFHLYVAGEDYTTEAPFDMVPERELETSIDSGADAAGADDGFVFVRW